MALERGTETAVPPLATECSVDDVFIWAQAFAEHFGPRLKMADDAKMMADAKMMLDKLWDGPEPRPPVEVIGALSFLPNMVGMSDEDANGWTSVILPMCSMPLVFRQAIRTNLREATFYLDDRVEVVVHDDLRLNDLRRKLADARQKELTGGKGP